MGSSSKGGDGGKGEFTPQLANGANSRKQTVHAHE